MPLKIGIAEVVITPPIGIALVGYVPRASHAIGIHDDLHARALVFSDGKTHRIRFALKAEDGFIIIRIEDTGVPFDPASPETAQAQPPVEDCKVGGLGLHLVKKMMDVVLYERCDNKNITTMKKKYLPET